MEAWAADQDPQLGVSCSNEFRILRRFLRPNGQPLRLVAARCPAELHARNGPYCSSKMMRAWWSQCCAHHADFARDPRTSACAGSGPGACVSRSAIETQAGAKCPSQLVSLAFHM